MDLTLVFWSVAGTAIVGGAIRRWWLEPDRRIKRLLHHTPATPIARASDGKVVKIVGELVYAGRSVESPLSQRACAYYSILVEEYVSHGRSGEWRDVVREARGVDFYIRDDSGMALVRVAPEHAFPALVQDRKARTSALIHSDYDLERFLATRGRSVEGVLFRKNFRASEGVLEQGERVAVAGLARWMPDPDAAGGSYRETPKRLVLEASDAMALFMSDDPGAI